MSEAPQTLQRKPILEDPGIPLTPNRGTSTFKVMTYGRDDLSNDEHVTGEGWLPLPLRPWFSIPLIIFMLIGAIVMEVLWFSNRQSNGWAANGKFASESGWQHYLFTLPPVIITMLVSALWAWTDLEVKRMQPYVELFGHKGASPQKSLLLDYTRTHNFFVWARAISNGHPVVALTTAIVLASLALQPLAAAWITVKDTDWIAPSVTIDNQKALSLNQNSAFQDLTTFLTSAGYASASAMFSLVDPPFTFGGFAISQFETFQLPSDYGNGTVTLNTSAVYTDAGCRPADQVNYNKRADGTGWDNSAVFGDSTYGDCRFNWNVNKSTTNLFGADLATNCSQFANTPQWFQPVVYWAFTYLPSPRGSITMCQPKISFWDVNVVREISTGSVIRVIKLGPFVPGTSPYSSFAGNLTGAPLNGQAYNGIIFDLTGSGDSDPFIQQRESAIRFALPGAIFQALQNSPQGLFAALGDSSMVNVASKVYTTYLSLVALETYFVDSVASISSDIRFVRKRVWFTGLATHLLVADFLVIFSLGLAVFILHRPARKSLRLPYVPGTIAAAVSMAGGSAVTSVLAEAQREEDLSTSLGSRRFRLNPLTMKIIMEGELGYEDAHSPLPRPMSVFADAQKSAFGLSRRLSQRVFGDSKQ